MKHLILILFAAVSVGSLSAQQSVTVNEPAEQCYQDLKANLPEAIRWDDEHLTVASRPLSNMSGSVQLVTRFFPEKGDTQCKLVVAIDATNHSVAWNAQNSSALFQTAALMKAKIETAMKAREKKQKEAKKE